MRIPLEPSAHVVELFCGSSFREANYLSTFGEFGGERSVHPVGIELLPEPLHTAKATEKYDSRAR